MGNTSWNSNNKASVESALRKNPIRLKHIAFVVSILLVIAIAWVLRLHAVDNLPIDYDEDDYLRAAQQFADLIHADRWVGFLDTNYRQEHPPLEKIVYALSILSAPQEPLIPDRPTSAPPNTALPVDLLHPARTTSAVLGTLEVAILAILNPLGGLFLGIHAFSIKYTSQVMLESLPALCSLVSVVTYNRWKKGRKRNINGWLAASGIFLGLTAASKYIYCVVGIAILVDWLWDTKKSRDWSKSFLFLFSWGLLAIVTFLAFDPFLWPNPIGRLKESIFYNASYSASASEVQNAGYPIWQPLVWLSMSPYQWHPQAFYFAIDPLITLLAAFGLKGLWQKSRIYVLWLAISLVFLLIWPTKWPQYILILTAPLSLSAAEGVMALIVRPVRARLARPTNKSTLTTQKRNNPWHQILPWLVPGMIVFAVFTLLPLIFQMGISLTDFNSSSIRDAFHGGLWREIWGGLTGQIHAIPLQLRNRSTQVHFTGWGAFSPVIEYISNNGILLFNLLWTVLSVLFQTILGLGVAMLLWQRGVRFGRIWQVIFILPWAIPEMIGALLWFNIFAPDWGWLSLAVQKYGPNFPLSFMTGWDQSANLRLLVLLIPAIWYGFPFMMLASLVGLRMIPAEVLDAAAIDGARPREIFRLIIWPLLVPLIIPAVIIRSIFSFNQFYLFQVFNFPDSTLATLSYNIFNPNTGGGQFAISAVINIVTVIILIGLVVVFNRWSKAGEGFTYA
jgi:ABC-type sugar transport system permease subunit